MYSIASFDVVFSGAPIAVRWSLRCSLSLKGLCKIELLEKFHIYFDFFHDVECQHSCKYEVHSLVLEQHMIRRSTDTTRAIKPARSTNIHINCKIEVKYLTGRSFYAVNGRRWLSKMYRATVGQHLHNTETFQKSVVLFGYRLGSLLDVLCMPAMFPASSIVGQYEISVK